MRHQGACEYAVVGMWPVDDAGVELYPRNAPVASFTERDDDQYIRNRFDAFYDAYEAVFALQYQLQIERNAKIALHVAAVERMAKALKFTAPPILEFLRGDTWEPECYDLMHLTYDRKTLDFYEIGLDGLSVEKSEKICELLARMNE